MPRISHSPSASVWPSFGLGVIVYAIDLLILFFPPMRNVPDWQLSSDGAHTSLAGWWHVKLSSGCPRPGPA